MSEIILQQTRVEQGWSYFERLVKAYPTIEKLARASDEQVFKLWEGLGYYSRCRNLLATARTVLSDYKGKFPDDYRSILALKGIGPYTAAAIASFAFNLPYAVVDGNVYRVLARYHGISTPIDSTVGKKQFEALAQKLLSKKQPGIYNQAIMDLGAVVCKPKQPLCAQCILNSSCKAFQDGLTDKLPVKTKSNAIKERWFNYFVIENKGRVMVRQRMEKDIWQHLFEFYLSEQTVSFKPITLRDALLKKVFGDAQIPYVKESRYYLQKLSHQLIHARFIDLNLPGNFQMPDNCQWVPLNRMERLPFPKIINEHLEERKARARAR